MLTQCLSFYATNQRNEVCLQYVKWVNKVSVYEYFFIHLCNINIQVCISC
jgi:hypothetical protein